LTDLPVPARKPARPFFSSGPCAKPPGYSPDKLATESLGRSHRAKIGKARLQYCIDLMRELLQLPETHRIGIVPGSDTGAVEMALWSLLGPKPVTVLAFESFSKDWAKDITGQLKLPATVLEAPYGALPDLKAIDWASDVVFCWNGTTSGVRLPAIDWIPATRGGLTICDATSAAFAMDLPWDRLDVVTWSWQKVLGGEAAHGMIALSPRAVERLTTHKPAWPLPKVFRMTASGKLSEGIFKGETINTPSMLCVEDQLDALGWAEKIGGLKGLIGRTEANVGALADWIAKSSWAAFLAEDAATRSSTSVCLKIVDPWFLGLAEPAQQEVAKQLAAAIETEGVGFDLGAYRDAPPGLRIWCGATVETSDIAALLPWLDWAYAQVKSKTEKAA
jgi:phosphoserine aminotransferase